MKKLLLPILIIAALLRLPFLGQFPNGFTGDEAQQGYSAFSILKTGRDEWGQVLPLFPKGFGDFKPPLYTYLTVPSVAIFGLTPEAVRLPAALLGILSVGVLYFLTKELFKDEKKTIFSTLFLSLSPWHIQISRTAWEGGTGILTFTLGLLFFLKSGTSNLNLSRNLILVAFFWGLTLYSYHSWRAFVLLFILGLVMFLKKKLVNRKNWIPGIILLIFILPLLANFNTILTRSSDVGIFSKSHLMGYFEGKGTNPLPPILDKAIDNKFWFLGNRFFENYVSYITPSFFFTGSRSDGTYLNFPGFGLIYYIEVIFWVYALHKILFKQLENKKILILWFLLAPIPAALTVGGMNANRAPTFLPLISIISGLGAVEFINWLKRFKLKIPAEILIMAILFFSLAQFVHFYIIKLPKNPPNNLRYGYDSVFKKALEIEGQYDHIVFSKVFTEPQIFVAFYSKMDPNTFQQASKDWLRYEKSDKLYVDQLESWNLGKFLFEDLNWRLKDSERRNSLIISKPEDFPSDVPSILDVKNPKGQIIYRLVPIGQ